MTSARRAKSRRQSPATRRAGGQRLRATLEDYAISSASFAEVLEVSPQCLANWCARGVPQARLPQLARLLSVSERWLATGEGARAMVYPCGSCAVDEAAPGT